jgi:membrane-associated phospholipid phosphatase
MKKKSKYRFILIKVIIFSLAVIGMVKPLYSQSPVRDTTFHPYHVNYWVTGGIIIVGIPATMIGAPLIANKSPLTNAEIDALDRNNFTAIDRWALNQDISNRGYYENLSNNVTGGSIVFPLLTMLDHNIRQDWLDIALMYAETQIIVNNIYLYSPFGPLFQNRFRPVVYYDALGNSPVRMEGTTRNSFYSGHTASAASATFFAAKVFCDYHPELGWKKCLIYGAAAIPPLIVGYLRMKALTHFPSDVLVGFGVGALCGIVIPEMHRIKIENVSLGVYSSYEGTGISLKWQPDFLK